MPCISTADRFHAIMFANGCFEVLHITHSPITRFLDSIDVRSVAAYSIPAIPVSVFAGRRRTLLPMTVT